MCLLSLVLGWWVSEEIGRHCERSEAIHAVKTGGLLRVFLHLGSACLLFSYALIYINFLLSVKTVFPFRPLFTCISSLNMHFLLLKKENSMSPVSIILILIILVNSLYLIRLLQDLINHKHILLAEPAKSWVLAISSPIIFFFSSFGVSDFAVSTVFYRMKNFVSDKKLPGTLNTQCVLPLAVMALAFISTIEVNLITLVVCILSQVAGAYLGPRLTKQVSASVIRKFIGAGLILSSTIILAGKLHLISNGGSAIGLSGLKLMIAAICLFTFGALNSLGIGSYALTMVTVYSLGMNPLVAFPIMMGSSTFALPVGSMQFIKYGQYSRKITLFTTILGPLGVLVGVFVVKKLNVAMLQWIIAAVLIYSGVSIVLQEFRRPKISPSILRV